MRYFPLLVCALSLAGAPLAQSARPKVALVLSGGGARGIAHIGVLRELEKAGLPMDLIVGTSFGAVAGGLYAVGYSSEDLGFLLQAVNFNDLLVDRSDRREQNYDLKNRKDAQLFDLELENWEIALPGGLQSGQRIRQFLDRLTAAPVYGANNHFDNLSIPFRAVATDIVTGKTHVFDSGSFSTAVLSSIAVPGFFSPVEVDSALLVDGGVADNIPVDVALANGADLVIAVDVSSPLKTRREEFKSLVDVLEQIIGFVMEEEEERNLQRADLVISPDLKGIGSFSFERVQDLIRLGEEAARAALPRLRAVLAAKHVILDPAEPRPRLVDPAQFDPETFEYRPREIVIEKIEIEGLKRNSPSYVRKQIDTPVNEQVGLATLDRDVTRLDGTDLFTRVAYLLEEKNSQTLLTYQVQESAPTKLGVSFRYDLDYEFSTGFDLTSHGIAGTHSNVFFRMLLGPLKNFELGWDSGQMLGKNNVVSSTVDFYSQKRRIFESHLNPAASLVAADIVGDYQDQRYGFSSSWRYLLETVGRFEVAYEVERVDIDRGVGPLTQKRFRDLAKLKAGVRFDTLDDAEFPTAGLQGGFGVERYDEGLGGDFSFTRYQGDAGYYFEAGRRNIVGLSGFWGLVRGDAPFYERLYTGGGQFSPFASTRFLGLERDEILSRHAAHLGLSYRYRLKEFRMGLIEDVYLAATYRTGLFNREPDLTGFGRPVHGLGLGIYVDAGFLGPVRLEVAGAGRGDLTTYFSIGHFF